MTAAGQPRKSFRIARLTFGLLLAAGVSAGNLAVPYAATTERVVVDHLSGLALYGIDPVAYFTRRKPTLGREDHEFRFAGAVWRFENEGNRAAFVADPYVYMPRFGGYDPIHIARGVPTAGYPELWLVADNRLYLFHSAQNRQSFAAQTAAAVAAAEAQWPKVEKNLVE